MSPTKQFFHFERGRRLRGARCRFAGKGCSWVHIPQVINPAGCEQLRNLYFILFLAMNESGACSLISDAVVGVLRNVTLLKSIGDFCLVGSCTGQNSSVGRSLEMDKLEVLFEGGQWSWRPMSKGQLQNFGAYRHLTLTEYQSPFSYLVPLSHHFSRSDLRNLLGQWPRWPLMRILSRNIRISPNAWKWNWFSFISAALEVEKLFCWELYGFQPVSELQRWIAAVKGTKGGQHCIHMKFTTHSFWRALKWRTSRSVIICIHSIKERRAQHAEFAISRYSETSLACLKRANCTGISEEERNLFLFVFVIDGINSNGSSSSTATLHLHQQRTTCIDPKFRNDDTWEKRKTLTTCLLSFAFALGSHSKFWIQQYSEISVEPCDEMWSAFEIGTVECKINELIFKGGSVTTGSIKQCTQADATLQQVKAAIATAVWPKESHWYGVALTASWSSTWKARSTSQTLHQG